MKIIKNNVEETECTCKRCGSIFSYNEYDIKKITSNWIRVGWEESVRTVYEEINCPVCKERYTIKEYEECY